MDRMLKANTVKTRTHSLVPPGLFLLCRDPRDARGIASPRSSSASENTCVREPVYVRSFDLK